MQIFNSVLALRKKAMPYMNTLWEAVAGLPLWRPMWLEFPDDDRFGNEMGQFMLGDRVLVAPSEKENFQWALDNGKLRRIPGKERKIIKK